MSLTIYFNTSIIEGSIVNPAVDASTAKDNTQPYSFLEFITITKVDYSPQEYNNFYLNYLKNWADIKNQQQEEQINFVDIYVNFLQEIVLVYSTTQEQKFLTTLNFNDPADLDIAIPFFAEKIRQIIIFYKEKRDDVKFAVDRNKIKGNTISVEKILFEKIYDYVFSTQDHPAFTSIGLTIEKLKQNLQISVEEFVDIYGNYFDVPPILTTLDRVRNLRQIPDKTGKVLTTKEVDELYALYNRNDNDFTIHRGVKFVNNEIITPPTAEPGVVISDKTLVSINTTQSELSSIVKTDISLREEIYSANINTIDAQVFFSDPSYGEVFGSTAFLQDLPLIVNISSQYDPVCDPTNPLDLLKQKDELRTGLTYQQIGDLRRRLISKYMGVDFHYVDTSGSIPVSGILFKAEDPWSNLSNLQAPTTPAVPAEFRNESNLDGSIRIGSAISLLRNVGLFFKPDKIGLFQLNSENFTYTIDSSKLEEQKVYIFPDPAVYGNVSINYQTDYPVVFVYDYTQDVKNVSYGFAQGDPLVQNDEQAFTPYYSREQSIEKNILTTDGLNLNFTDLFNKGYITKIQYDVYGNEYALFKDEFGMTFKGISELDADIILSKLLNGHVFYDEFEGYSFNYYLTGVNGTTIRSGMSSHTVDSEPYPAFILTGAPLTLYFREFVPYQELAEEARNIIPVFVDGGGFTFIDGEALPDPILADNSAYPSPLNYYYSLLTEAGVSSLDPPTRPVFNESYTETNADFELDVKFALSAINVTNYNCGYFTDDLALSGRVLVPKDYNYYNTVDARSTTVLSQLSATGGYITQGERDLLKGKAFVKNQAYSLSYPLSTALQSIFNKYSDEIKTEIYTSLIDLNVYYDVIVATTPLYMIFDKIVYEDSQFKQPNTKNTVFSLLSNSFITKFTDCFFKEKEKTLTFCKLVTMKYENGTYVEVDRGGSDKLIVPYIYEYSIRDNITKTLFPMNDTHIQSVSSMFALENVFTEDYTYNIIKITDTALTYNSLNDVFKVTYVCTDNNNLFHIFDYEFYINGEGSITFGDGRTYRHNKILRTTDFYSQDTYAKIANNTSSTYTISSGKLTI